ncbi:MAG: hypothetical protein MHMPM18_000525 [Marteilia pararefringens]
MSDRFESMQSDRQDDNKDLRNLHLMANEYKEVAIRMRKEIGKQQDIINSMDHKADSNSYLHRLFDSQLTRIGISSNYSIKFKTIVIIVCFFIVLFFLKKIKLI